MQSARGRALRRLIGALVLGVIVAAIVRGLGTSAHYTPPTWALLIGFYIGAGIAYAIPYSSYPFRNWIASPTMWMAGKLIQYIIAIIYAPIALPLGIIRDIRALSRQSG